MKLTLDDLCPLEADFELSTHPGTKFTLKRFSLRAQLWMQNEFGAENIEGIFKNQRLPELSKVAFFLLKDKTVIKTLEDLQESVVTNKDRIALMAALLRTIGVSQPVMEAIAKEVGAGNAESLNRLIGALSSTSSQPNTQDTQD